MAVSAGRGNREGKKQFQLKVKMREEACREHSPDRGRYRCREGLRDTVRPI